ncbi:MAG: hypothetical protein JRF15_12840 [Deltaproteobacteria bacterium]|jgi:hypothetical protein|nr:hypothetical protein [Deltaproteobacteria bacterium]
MRDAANPPSIRGTEPTGLADGLRGIFRIPPPAERVRAWHVSPAIDMAAYHFSWLWVLLPLLFAGPEYPVDYLPCYVFVVAVGFVHRHYTLGYAYLDGEIFARHRTRFIYTPLILGAAFLATPFLVRASIPVGVISIGGLHWPEADLRLKLLVTAVIFGAGVWNIWHTLAQKYGILRIYTAKAHCEREASVPGWVDRLLVMGWLPLIVTYVAPPFADAIQTEFKIAGPFVQPIVAWLLAAEPIAAPISALLALASSATFAVFEWRTHRFRNRPRLSMAIGLGSLWACFLLVDPIKVYLAFAFSHGLEYMVFVWAYQRRRYAEPRSPEPTLARLLRHPWLTYSSYSLALAAIYIGLQDWEGFSLWELPSVRVADMKLGAWIFYWGVFQSLLHFYFDGFLWKTRRPEVRQSL